MDKETYVKRMAEKKDGEPSKIIIHANTWDKIYKA